MEEDDTFEVYIGTLTRITDFWSAYRTRAPPRQHSFETVDLLAGSHVNAGAVVRRKRKQRAVSSVTQDTVIEPLTPDSQTSLLSGI
jgi:hypothetical protein